VPSRNALVGAMNVTLVAFVPAGTGPPGDRPGVMLVFVVATGPVEGELRAPEAAACGALEWLGPPHPLIANTVATSPTSAEKQLFIDATGGDTSR
jgi:hypothetical protein